MILRNLLIQSSPVKDLEDSKLLIKTIILWIVIKINGFINLINYVMKLWNGTAWANLDGTALA